MSWSVIPISGYSTNTCRSTLGRRWWTTSLSGTVRRTFVKWPSGNIFKLKLSCVTDVNLNKFWFHTLVTVSAGPATKIFSLRTSPLHKQEPLFIAIRFIWRPIGSQVQISKVHALNDVKVRDFFRSSSDGNFQSLLYLFLILCAILTQPACSEIMIFLWKSLLNVYLSKIEMLGLTPWDLKHWEYLHIFRSIVTFYLIHFGHGNSSRFSNYLCETHLFGRAEICLMMPFFSLKSWTFS